MDLAKKLHDFLVNRHWNGPTTSTSAAANLHFLLCPTMCCNWLLSVLCLCLPVTSLVTVTACFCSLQSTQLCNCLALLVVVCAAFWWSLCIVKYSIFFSFKVRRPAYFKDFFVQKYVNYSTFFSLKSAGLRTLRIFSKDLPIIRLFFLKACGL